MRSKLWATTHLAGLTHPWEWCTNGKPLERRALPGWPIFEDIPDAY